MTFTLDTEVARVLQAALEKNGPPPAPPAGDVQTRRVTLDAMLEYFTTRRSRPPMTSRSLTVRSPRQMVPRCWPDGTGGRRVTPAPPRCICTAAG